MKKILITLMATAALSGAASAKGFTGFYVGADAGANLYNTDYSLNGGTNPLFLNVNGHSSSFNMGFFVGYSRLFANWFILGTEFFGCGDTHKGKIIELSDRVLIMTQNKGLSGGFLVRTGAKFTEKTAIMIGLGGKSADHQYAFIDRAFPSPANNFLLRSKKFLFTIQAGLEGVFGPNDSWGWRATYGFTPGEDADVFSLPSGGIYGDPPFNASNARFRTDEHTMRFGVSFRF